VEVETVAEESGEEDEEPEEEDTEEEELEEVEEAPESVEDIIEVELSEITIDVIKDGWGKVVQKIKPIHNHLFAFLRTATPLKIENSVLIIEVPFEFHKDRIESVKSRESIMSVMREVYGNVMKIE